MRKLSIFPVILVFSILSSIGCDSTTAPRGKGSFPSTLIIDQPREDKEAEEAALWLSGELEAPQELYDTILDDLAQIRDAYSAAVPEVGITFMPRWVAGMLLIGVTNEAKQQIRQGQYHDLDSLNAYYHLAEMDTSSLFNILNSVKLTFMGRLHPEVLSVPYGAIESVTYAEPNHYCCDWSNVYPWFSNDGMTYLFRKGEGDCPSGCIDSYFWYFRVSDGGVIDYVGTWKLRDLPEPDWWAEAKVAYERFRYGY
jgi:hypothetical protein